SVGVPIFAAATQPQEMHAKIHRYACGARAQLAVSDLSARVGVDLQKQPQQQQVAQNTLPSCAEAVGLHGSCSAGQARLAETPAEMSPMTAATAATARIRYGIGLARKHQRDAAIREGMRRIRNSDCCASGIWAHTVMWAGCFFSRSSRASGPPVEPLGWEGHHRYTASLYVRNWIPDMRIALDFSQAGGIDGEVQARQGCYSPESQARPEEGWVIQLSDTKPSDNTFRFGFGTKAHADRSNDCGSFGVVFAKVKDAT
ncbi:MAG: hypothetical protein SGPRY_003316, partial [Prymnesium sp.]